MILRLILYGRYIYLWSKVVCFVCVLSCWDVPNYNATCHILGIFEKLLMSRGASTWFEIVWNYGVESIDCWTNFPMKINLNQNWKLYWNLRCFWCCWKGLAWQVRFNRVYFTILKAKVWKKILIFELILLMEIKIS
jgi:hypothetical protein